MTDKQFFRNYIKSMNPIGSEIYDSVRGYEPFIIKKNSVFEVFPWTASDYNPDFLPEDPDDYTVEFLVTANSDACSIPTGTEIFACPCPIKSAAVGLSSTKLNK